MRMYSPFETESTHYFKRNTTTKTEELLYEAYIVEDVSRLLYYHEPFWLQYISPEVEPLYCLFYWGPINWKLIIKKTLQPVILTVT